MSWNLYPISKFENFQNNWQQLNCAAFNSPLLSLDFVMPLLEIFGKGNEILACYQEKDELKIMAIIRPKNQWIWSTFQPSQAPLGIWIQKRDVDLLSVLPELIQQLSQCPLVFSMTQIDPDLVARPEISKKLVTLDYIQTARITLQGDFEEYWTGRGKNLRQNMKKQRNKLVKDGVITRLELCVLPVDVQQAIVDYGKLESSGWKLDQGTAIHSSNNQGRFYQKVLENFCHRGKGRIYRYWFNDQIVAMDLCIEGEDDLIILKTTYDESWKHSFSPAFLMREEEFKQIFDENKVKRIEFYGRVMDWHTKWSNEIRMLYHINSYRWSTVRAFHRLTRRLT